MSRNPSFLNSVKWAYTASWGEKTFSAVFTFVLAGILGPRDFGIVSIAVIYIAFLQLFLDQGLAAALIQRKHLEQEHMDAVFWMDLVLSVFLILVSILFSRRWAAMNHAPEVARVISVLSVCILIEAMALIQSALLRREMDFKSISIRTNASMLVGGVVGIVMAFAGFRVWALVGQQIVRDSTALVLLWKLSPWRPRFEFSWNHLKELMGFSIPNFVSQLGVFAGAQADSLVLGFVFGPVAVGLYRVADRVVNSIVTMATSSVQAVSLPEFSKVQDQPEQLSKSALTCVRLSSTVTLPVLSGVAVVSWALMASLGTTWIPASNALKILCVVGISSVFSSFTGPLLQAVSRPHQHAMLEWARMAVGALLLIGTGILARKSPVEWQIVAIALARLVTMACLVTPIFLYILMRLAGISFGDLLSAVMPSALASLSAVGAVILFQISGLLVDRKPVILLIAETIIGGIVGLAVLLVFDSQLRGLALSLKQRTFRSLAFSRGA
jgi:O-antigen/teichoic acid export membrane protein